MRFFNGKPKVKVVKVQELKDLKEDALMDEFVKCGYSDEDIAKAEEITRIRKMSELELSTLYDDINKYLDNGRYNACVRKVDEYIAVAEKYGLIVHNGVFDRLLIACKEGGSEPAEILSVYDDIVEYYTEHDRKDLKNSFLDDKEYYIEKL